MAYTVPHTWVAGDFLRASWLNLTTTDLVDHEARIVALEATGTGNVTGQASSVDSEIALFSSTTGKVIKRATGTGYVKASSGVYQTPSATIPLATDVSGDLPFANLTQGSALSVLGVTGNTTADHASIAAASDGQVLRRSGTALGFGAVDLANANAITGALPLANLPTTLARFLKTTISLTDAQIKALPTTPITVVSAQGSGTVIVPILGHLHSNFTAGAYTNVNTTWASISIGPTGIWLLNPIVNDNSLTIPLARLTTLLGANERFVTLDVYQEAIQSGGGAGDFGVVQPQVILGTSEVSNVAVTISADNNGSGNFTGGNAANSLSVTVLYLVL